jgi:protein-S-isoprenylcysteine O-methyltransferase Ste14
VSTMDTHRSHNWFVRAAAAIGDLSNPFFAEERQRDVWNEASAVALQVLLWLNLVAATAAVWFVGADALPYVYALLAMIGIAGWIAILYSWNLGVHVEERKWMSRRRLVPVLVLALLLLGGMLRAQTGDVVADWSTIAGVLTGVASVVVVFTATAWFVRRRAGAREASDS